MITPTHLKDYRNPHIARIWYGAAQALQQAERVHIIGYSLPPGDIDVAYLLKRNLHHMSPERISVVEYDLNNRGNNCNEVGRRYRALFGENIEWFTGGFEVYADQIQNQRRLST